MAIEFLSVEVVIMLHAREMAKTPSEPAEIHDMGRLESAVAAPEFYSFYKGEQDICVLAANYVLHVARNHAFMSGNKRTALAAGITFLEGNGYLFLRDDEEFGKLIERLINHQAELEDVATFLKANSRNLGKIIGLIFITARRLRTFFLRCRRYAQDSWNALISGRR